MKMKFNINYEPKLKNKKRSYNIMKGNIIQNLYKDDEEFILSIFK